MGLLKTGKLPHRLWSLFRRDRLETGLANELQFHIQKETEKNLKAGMTPEEARYAALCSFGGVEEQCREVRRMKLIETVCQDIRFAVRTLSKNLVYRSSGAVTGIGYRGQQHDVQRHQRRSAAPTQF
jgi:hypothetical protein